jgi:hypothetical protein
MQSSSAVEDTGGGSGFVDDQRQNHRTPIENGATEIEKSFSLSSATQSSSPLPLRCRSPVKPSPPSR